MNDRRRTGVNQVVIEGENGDTTRIITATAKRVHIWIGCLIAVLSLGGMVYTMVRTGVNVEIEDVVEEMAADENSGLHLQMHRCAEEEAELVAGAMQDDLDIFEAEQKALTERTIRMEERQIGLSQKMDDDKRDIIEEIRRNRDGGG